MNEQEFANKIRTKYPGAYDNLSDTELTQKVIAKYPVYADSVKLNTSTTIQQPTPETGLKGFAQGIAKGEISTVKGLADIGEKIASQTAGRIVNAVQGKGFVPTPVQDSFTQAVGGENNVAQLTKPETPAEQLGFGTEKIAEYFLPASKAAKAESIINTLSKGITSPLLSATTRVAGKSAVQGLASGIVNLFQTGGNFKEAATTALTAGGTRGLLATGGEALRALKIPERVYSIIFKNTKEDMLSELKSDALAKMARENPIKYQDFVDKGIIKVTNGNPTINETLAEQALNRGLSGSLKNMSETVITKSIQAEDDVQNILKNYKGTVDVSEKQFTNVLKNIAEDYRDVGFGEVSNVADNLVNKIETTGGKLDGQSALQLRRFLDRMRLTSSFDKPVSKLSQTQANFKTLADNVRGKLSKIDGVAPIMKDYSFYLDAMESIAKDAARRGNAQVLGMIDSLFLGGASISPDPSSILTVGLLRRLVQSPKALTAIGQILKNPNIGTKTSGALGALSGGISNILGSQESNQ